MEKQKKVERWSYPFKAKGEGNAASREVTDPQVYYDALAKAESGYYPISSNGLWHGGVHFDQNTATMLDQSSVRCIADGVVVAYRIDESYQKLTYTGSGTPKEVTYSTGFVLVRHRLELPPAPAATPPAGGTPAPATPPAPEADLTFYSLYMHLKDWESYKQDGAPTPPTFLSPTQYAVSEEHATNDFAGLYVRGGAPGTPAHANKVSIIPKGCKVQVGVASTVNAHWRKLVSILEGQPSPALTTDIEHWVFTGEMTPTGSSDIFLIGQKANDVQASLLAGKGLTVRKEAKHNSAAMAVLPVGTELQLEDGTGKYRKIKSITASSLTAPVSPGCAANIQGFVHFDSLKAVPLPPTLNAVHVLPEPVPITAGALIGHLGKYQAASQGQAHDLLHLEVFTCDDIEAFITKSRARAEQLKPEQKSLLKIPSETKVIDKAGASKDNPPLPSDPGNPTAYDMIFPLAVLNALPADRKITVSTTTGGTTTSQQWWKLDNLPGKDGNPLSGWVKEDEIITPRLHPWSWEGFDFIKETSTPSDQYVCKLSTDGVLDDGEKTNYKAQVNAGDGGAIKTRLYEIIDVDSDEKLTPTEIRNALAKPWHAQSISRLIAQYESEWYADEGLSKWEALNCYMTKEAEKDWDKEKDRIRSLLWLRDLTGSGSNLTEVAWHIHPITAVACFNSSCIPVVQAQEIALLVSTGYEGKAELDFEALAGNFDQQGMSFGIIQWNFGQGTLGPVLKEMRDTDSAAFDACFGANMNLQTLINALNSGDQTAQFNWSTSVQSSNQAGWKQAFKNIGEVEQFKAIQLKHAAKYHDNVLKCISLMREIASQHMTSVQLRTYVALYDLCVQQNDLTKAKQDIIAGYPSSNVSNQHELLIYVCKKRAERAASAWVADCLSRRMGIIQGSTYTATANGLTSSRVNPNLGKIIAGTVCEL
ncbi:hypothetical protein D9M69_307850 [compost metagenome]